METKPTFIGTGWKTFTGLLEAAKPQQWLKTLNLMLIASTYALGDLQDVSRLLYGVLIVGSLLWGGLYIVNDITDRKDDSRHPIKRFHPFASGQVEVHLGIWVSGLMIGLAILLGINFGIRFTLCLILMCTKQLVYTLPKIRLKEKFFWDVISGSLGNASLRFAAGWFLFSKSLKMPLLLLLFVESLQLAGFFVNRLYANYGIELERKLQYNNTTTGVPTRNLKIVIASCCGMAIACFILLLLNGLYQILPPIFGELPIQCVVFFIIFLLCIPFLAKTIRRAEKFSSQESPLYYVVPLLRVFVSVVLVSFILKYYG